MCPDPALRGDSVDLPAPRLAEALDRARHELSTLPGASERACAAEGVRFLVVADQPAVTRPLVLAGLDRVLDLQTTP